MRSVKPVTRAVFVVEMPSANVEYEAKVDEVEYSTTKSVIAALSTAEYDQPKSTRSGPKAEVNVVGVGTTTTSESDVVPVE